MSNSIPFLSHQVAPELPFPPDLGTVTTRRSGMRHTQAPVVPCTAILASSSHSSAPIYPHVRSDKHQESLPELPLPQGLNKREQRGVSGTCRPQSSH